MFRLVDTLTFGALKGILYVQSQCDRTTCYQLLPLAGNDYTGTPQANAVPVMFPPGQMTTTINVPIINDEVAEGTERFFGRLQLATGSTVTIFANQSTVDILDTTDG